MAAHIKSWLGISYHGGAYYIMARHISSWQGMLTWHVIPSCQLVAAHIKSWHGMSYHGGAYHILARHVMSWQGMLYHRGESQIRLSCHRSKLSRWGSYHVALLCFLFLQLLRPGLYITIYEVKCFDNLIVNEWYILLMNQGDKKIVNDH